MSLNNSATEHPPSHPPVIVLFNQPAPSTRAEDRAAEVGVLDAVASAVSALAKAGFSVETLGLCACLDPLMQRIEREPAVVLNFCEAFAGRMKGEAYVAALLEMLGVPYTGSAPDAILLCLNKIRTKRLLAGCGLPTPPFFEFRPPHHSLDDTQLAATLDRHNLKLPAVVKPSANDASEGIYQSSVVRNISELRAVTHQTGNVYGYPVLVEQYIAGREFNVAVIDNPTPRMLPPSEIIFKYHSPDWWPIVTYDAKWVDGSHDDRSMESHCPAAIDQDLRDELERLSLETIRHTGCRDYARIDMRVDSSGQPYILEVNANPDTSPVGGLHWQLEAAGISHDDFIVNLVRQAAQRTPLPARRAPGAQVPRPSGAPDVAHPLPGLKLRSLEPGDRAEIQQLLERCGNFREGEIEIGLELVDQTLHKTDVEDYQFIIACFEGRVVGYSCFGPVPLTDNVWDLYWLAVDPSLQRHGIASRLQAATEQRIREAGGRLVLAETSSLPSYAQARGFYLRHGYQLLERLADFYRPGDDRLTFGKQL